jgi:Zn-finger domain-containing protein
VPKPDDSSTMVTLEPSRRRLILDRLHSDFYDEALASERIAVAVLAALRDLDQGPSLPH